MLTASALQAAEQPNTISGRVTADGRPVAGAKVSSVDTHMVDPKVLATTTTDADGRFTVSTVGGEQVAGAGKSVMVEADGWGLGFANRQAGTTDLDLELPPATELRVPFVDEHGKALAELPVRITFLFASTPDFRYLRAPVDGGPRLSCVTDDHGVAHFPGLPQDITAAFEVDSDHYARLSQETDRRSALAQAVSEVDPIALEVAATLSGRITFGPTGEPAPNAMVAWRSEPDGDWARVETGDEGRFTITRARPGQGCLALLPLGDLVGKWTAPAHQNVVVAAGQTVDDLDFTLVEGVELVVKVVDQDGHPMPNLPISVGGPQWPTELEFHTAFGGSTGDDGAYRLRVVPGEQHARIAQSLRGYENERQPEGSVTAVAGQPAEIRIQVNVPPAVKPITGVVQGPDGQPVADAEILIDPTGGRQFWPGTRPHTDANGHFDLGELTPRDGGSLRARKGDLATAEPVAATPGDEVTLTLAQGVLGRILATVNGPDGTPLAGARVTLFEWNDNTGWSVANATTDATGQVMLEHCWPAEHYRVQAEAPGFGRANSEQFALKPGELVPVEPLQLEQADRFVAGFVVDVQGNPVAGAIVHVQGARSTYHRGVADNRGEFRIEGLVDEKVSVNATTPDQKMSGHAEAQAGDENVAVKLDQKVGH